MDMERRSGIIRWIAKVTSSLHDLFPVFTKSCKTKFRKTMDCPLKPKVNFTNIVQPGIYSYKGNCIFLAGVLAYIGAGHLA